MSRYTLFRNLPTRTARRLRAGVFVAIALGLSGMGSAATAQGKSRMGLAGQRNNGYGRAAMQPQRQRPMERPAQAPPQQNRPMERAAEQPSNPVAGGGAPLVNKGHPAEMAGHLGSWMQAHSNLTPAQQHAALEAEPGFHTLAPEEQMRLHNQLTNLNRMAPDQQQRRIQFTEQMERLAPPQRQQVRNVLGQLGSLPEDRQHAVTRAYRQLRDMPEGQRQAYMNSPQFRSQFNDTERATVGNMVNAAPLLRSFEAPANAGPPKE